MTRRIQTQLSAKNELAASSTSSIDDLTKAKAGFNIVFKGDGKTMRFRELVHTRRT